MPFNRSQNTFIGNLRPGEHSRNTSVYQLLLSENKALVCGKNLSGIPLSWYKLPLNRTLYESNVRSATTGFALQMLHFAGFKTPVPNAFESMLHHVTSRHRPFFCAGPAHFYQRPKSSTTIE
jgi:hypothetical protein